MGDATKCNMKAPCDPYYFGKLSLSLMVSIIDKLLKEIDNLTRISLRKNLINHTVRIEKISTMVVSIQSLH